jgi:hypothetical protein
MDENKTDTSKIDENKTDTNKTDTSKMDANKTDTNKTDTNKTDENKKDANSQITKCIYDEICSEDKMCGDCSTDMYERDKYEEDYENYKIDCEMALYDNCLY